VKKSKFCEAYFELRIADGCKWTEAGGGIAISGGMRCNG
jgi:hypothetical protein